MSSEKKIIDQIKKDFDTLYNHLLSNNLHQSAFIMGKLNKNKGKIKDEKYIEEYEAQFGYVAFKLLIESKREDLYLAFLNKAEILGIPGNRIEEINTSCTSIYEEQKKKQNNQTETFNATVTGSQLATKLDNTVLRELTGTGNRWLKWVPLNVLSSTHISSAAINKKLKELKSVKQKAAQIKLAHELLDLLHLKIENKLQMVAKKKAARKKPPYLSINEQEDIDAMLDNVLYCLQVFHDHYDNNYAISLREEKIKQTLEKIVHECKEFPSLRDKAKNYSQVLLILMPERKRAQTQIYMGTQYLQEFYQNLLTTLPGPSKSNNAFDSEKFLNLLYDFMQRYSPENLEYKLKEFMDGLTLEQKNILAKGMQSPAVRTFMQMVNYLKDLNFMNISFNQINDLSLRNTVGYIKILAGNSQGLEKVTKDLNMLVTIDELFRGLNKKEEVGFSAWKDGNENCRMNLLTFLQKRVNNFSDVDDGSVKMGSTRKVTV